MLKVITATERPCLGPSDGRRAAQATAPVVICVNVRGVLVRVHTALSVDLPSLC